MATTAQSDSVLELYSAYFNRAADATGFAFWVKSFDTFFAGADATADDAAKTLFALQKIATDMSTAKEYTDLYSATQPNADFIKAIYLNLLGRSDPDPEGLAFWVGHIDAGTMTKEQAIVNMIDGAKNNTTDQGKLDAALIANKNAVSKYFAETLKSDDVAVAKTAFANLTNAPTDSAAEITAAKAALDAAVAATTAVQLTVGTDNITGTAENDTIASANGTLQSNDSVIDSSASDADVLNISMNVFDSSISPTIIGIETINVISSSLPGLNLSNVKGTTINIDSTSAGGVGKLTNVTSKAGNIVAGSNIGNITVSAPTSGTLDGGVSVNTGNATVVAINGGGGTDVFSVTTATGLVNLSVDAGTTGTADQFFVELNGTVENGAVFSSTGVMNELILNAKTEAAVLNVKGTALIATELTLLGDQDITFMGDPMALGVSATKTTLLDSNSGVLTFKVNASTTAAFLSDAAFDVVDIATKLNSNLTVNSNSTVKLSADAGTGFSIEAATGILKLDNAFATGSFKVNSDAELSNTTVVATLSKLDLNSSTVKLIGDKDLTIAELSNTGGSVTVTSGLVTATAGELDASAFGSTLIVKDSGSTSVTIKGGTGADQITGSTSVDVLSGGEGIDIITGGSGDDFIDLTETTSVQDTVKYSTGDDFDTIKAFTTGTDKFDTNFAPDAKNFNFKTIATGSDADLTSEIGFFGVIEFTGAASGGTQATANANVLAAMTSAGTPTAIAASDKFMVILNTGADSYLYEVINDTSTVIDAPDTITLVGKFESAALAAGDII
jgi:hypothetical protein